MCNRVIYLDYHATTPMDPRVGKRVRECMERTFGNPESDHAVGDEAEDVVRAARAEVAGLVGTTPERVIFTSGATEALNLAIQGYVHRRMREAPGRRVSLGVLPVEHVAVLEVCRKMVQDGWATLVEFRVDSQGRLDLDHLDGICRHGLDLACIMAANNEVGTVYPLPDVAAITQKRGVKLLTDATQAVGKVPVQFDDSGLDFLALSGHKLYGPKGIGSLCLASRADVDPPFVGGVQEGGVRPGTLNVPGIAGLGEACRLRRLEMELDEPAIAERRNLLENMLKAAVPELVVNGDLRNRLAGNLHVSIPGLSGSAVVATLRRVVALSTGSACSSGAVGPSHVLRALCMGEHLAEGSLRMGLGKFTSIDEVEMAASLIVDCVRRSQLAVR
jgi:cysteine desulfurase